jgi:3'-5' exoribonuclease-like protein
MLYFFDTEFIEDGSMIDLISIGIVADGRELYACNQEARLDRANDWVRANVLPKLPPYGDKAWMRREQIKEELLQFTKVTQASLTPEFWAYYCSYDWVALCQLFGKMIDLPKHFPMWCRDLKQLSMDVGDPKHPKQREDKAHNALEDARYAQELYVFLMKHKAAVDAYAVEKALEKARRST